MRPLHEWADLVYLPHSRVAHIRPWTRTTESSLCGFVSPPLLDSWRGTGSQAEYDKAQSLPLCRRCKQAAEQQNRKVE